MITEMMQPFLAWSLFYLHSLSGFSYYHQTLSLAIADDADLFLQFIWLEIVSGFFQFVRPVTETNTTFTHREICPPLGSMLFLWFFTI